PVVLPAYWFVQATVARKRVDCTQSVSVPPLVHPCTFVVTCVTCADVDAAKLASPLKLAVIGWEPTTNADVVNVATPPLSVPVPSTAAPSLNMTVPVGVPVAGETAVTVAVKVTLVPTTAGFFDDESAVALPF